MSSEKTRKPTVKPTKPVPAKTAKTTNAKLAQKQTTAAPQRKQTSAVKSPSAATARTARSSKAENDAPAATPNKSRTATPWEDVDIGSNERENRGDEANFEINDAVNTDCADAMRSNLQLEEKIRNTREKLEKYFQQSGEGGDALADSRIWLGEARVEMEALKRQLDSGLNEEVDKLTSSVRSAIDQLFGRLKRDFVPFEELDKDDVNLEKSREKYNSLDGDGKKIKELSELESTLAGISESLLKIEKELERSRREIETAEEQLGRDIESEDEKREREAREASELEELERARTQEAEETMAREEAERSAKEDEERKKKKVPTATLR